MTRAVTFVIVGVLTTAALAAQEPHKVYTNADLDRPLTPTRPPAAVAAQLLAPRQFVPLPVRQHEPRGYGPQLLVLDSSPSAGPFGELHSTPIVTESLTDTNTRFAIEAFSGRTGIPTQILMPLTRR